MYVIKDLQTGLYYSKFSHKKRFTTNIETAQKFGNFDRASNYCQGYQFVVDIKEERVKCGTITYRIRVQDQNYYKNKLKKKGVKQ